MKDVRDNIMDSSSEEKGTLGKALVEKLVARVVPLPGKSEGKSYVVVVQKVTDGERLGREVSQPTAVGSST